MTRVFPSTLLWKDFELQKLQRLGEGNFQNSLAGKRITNHAVFLGSLVAYLVVEANNSDAIVLEASGSPNGAQHHNPIRVFVTNEQGEVVERFPKDLTVESVALQTAKSSDRKYCGKAEDNVSLTAVVFTFFSSAQVIRLHFWEQCKEFPCCGSPYIPQYMLPTKINSIQEVNIQDSSFQYLCNFFQNKFYRDSFLSPGFRGVVNAFGSIHLYDASGFEPLIPQKFIHEADAFGLCWSMDRAHCIKPHLPKKEETRLVTVKFKSVMLGHNRAFLAKPRRKKSRLRTIRLGISSENENANYVDMVERTKNDRVFFVCEGITYDEIKIMPSELLLSKQLGLLSKESNIQVLCWNVEDIQSIFGYFKDQKSNLPSRSAPSFGNNLSLRVAFPCGIFGSENFSRELQKKCSSHIVPHRGSSLGYHLVNSSEGYFVITLFGSAGQLIEDMKWIEVFRNSLQLHRFSVTKEAYAVLRLARPSPTDTQALVFAWNEIFFDAKNEAVYSSMHFAGQGNASWQESIPHIKKLLNRMLMPSTAKYDWQQAAIRKIVCHL